MPDPNPSSGPAPDDAELARRRAALDARLGSREEARSQHPSNAARSDLARGLKLSSEFIAGVLVGALLGYLIDRLAGTSPFGLIVFLLLGFAAGILNVLRETGQAAKAESRVVGQTGDERAQGPEKNE